MDFKCKATNLTLMVGYSVADAYSSLDIGETVLRWWIDQLNSEQLSVTPKA